MGQIVIRIDLIVQNIWDYHMIRIVSIVQTRWEKLLSSGPDDGVDSLKIIVRIG